MAHPCKPILFVEEGQASVVFCMFCRFYDFLVCWYRLCPMFCMFSNLLWCAILQWIPIIVNSFRFDFAPFDSSQGRSQEIPQEREPSPWRDSSNGNPSAWRDSSLGSLQNKRDWWLPPFSQFNQGSGFWTPCTLSTFCLSTTLDTIIYICSSK